MEPNKLIVVYMDDERKGFEAAQLFTQKGYDNIYLLSGGFESFAESYPDLLEGKMAAKMKAPSPVMSPLKEGSKAATIKKTEKKEAPLSATVPPAKISPPPPPVPTPPKPKAKIEKVQTFKI